MSIQFCFRTRAVLRAAWAFFLPLAALHATEPVDYVDTMIGTGNGGNTFPGPSLPNGFVKLSPDTDMKRAGGYDPRGKIRHFSHNHVSGMGGPKYGNVGLMPVVGHVDPTRLGHLSAKADEVGQAGYYRVSLVDYGITAELTATMHAGMHRYTFPENNDSHILVDVGASLQGTGKGWDSSIPTGGHVSIDPVAGEVSGYNSFVGGRASGPWKIYFVSKFDTPFDSYGTWLDANVTAGVRSQDGAWIGACLNFKTKAGQAIKSKVGLSFVSVEQARRNLDGEIPAWDFEKVHNQARAAWAAELGKIEVQGPSEADKTIFYTGVYHMELMPTDFTHENPYFDYGRPYYDDFLCIWDIFRANFPLHFLINAPKSVDMLNSLVDVYRHDGWLPDSRSAVSYDGLQNGTNADVLFAEAWAKGLKGVDYETAVKAMIKNGEQPTDNPRHYGRTALSDYLKKGYVPVGATNCVSRTVEYVYDDYCTYTLCMALGRTSDAERFKSRLLWYKNVWDDSIGFMRGKNLDGSWITPFDPAKEQGSYDVVFYEGNAYQWSYYAPHDGRGLVKLYGGDAAFVSRLDDMCAHHYAVWNEPDMLNPYLFPWAGRPDRTAFHVRNIMRSYGTSVSGLPGNDDSGTTSAWYVWGAMGIYPVAGQDLYIIASPIFSKVTIHLSNGKDFVIRADATSATNKYVQSATLNGAPYDKAYFKHSDVAAGAILDLSMGGNVSSWATTTRPPSFSDDAPAGTTAR